MVISRATDDRFGPNKEASGALKVNGRGLQLQIVVGRLRCVCEKMESVLRCMDFVYFLGYCKRLLKCQREGLGKVLRSYLMLQRKRNHNQKKSIVVVLVANIYIFNCPLELIHVAWPCHYGLFRLMSPHFFAHERVPLSIKQTGVVK